MTVSMEWFYEHNGKAVGPVSRPDLIRLIVQRHIHPYTLVWTADFGDEWRPASHAGLIMPHPLQMGEGQGRRRPFFEIRIEKLGKLPVPDHQGEVGDPAGTSSFWAWILLLVPDFLVMLPQLVAYVHGLPWSPDTSLLGVVGIYAIAIIAVVSDRRELRRVGIVPPFLGWFLIPPVYFWLRAVRLGRGRWLFLCSMLMIILKALVIFYNPPPELAERYGSDFRGWKYALVQSGPTSGIAGHKTDKNNRGNSNPLTLEEQKIPSDSDVKI